MTGILALVGSGEFTENMVDIDKFLLAQTKNPKVAILPTAAGQEEKYYQWIEDGVKHFKNLGVEVEGVHLLKREEAESKEIAEKLSNFDFYYFSGGNPGYLLDTIKNTLCWEVIFKNFSNGATLVGASAGAMVMGAMVWARVYEFANNNKVLPWEEGLGVVDFGVVPHYDYILHEFPKDKWVKAKKSFPKNLKIVGIDEDSAFIKNGDTWQVMGKGKIHEIQSSG